jgi:hypothetical protein
MLDDVIELSEMGQVSYKPPNLRTVMVLNRLVRGKRDEFLGQIEGLARQTGEQKGEL